MGRWWKTAWTAVRRTVAGVGEDDLMTHAAALAFYSALSFAPLLVLLLWLAASLQPDWQARLIVTLNNLVGPRASGAVKLVVDNASERPQLGSWAGLLGVGVTLVGASAVFAQLQHAINRIWNLRAQPGNAVVGWLRARMRAFGVLLSLAFLLVISFAVSAAIALFVRGDTVVWQVIELVASLLVFCAVFGAIFRVLPDALIDWHDALIGAALTALLFAVGKFGISLFLSHSSVGGAYGPASSVVVLLVWVYYSAVILLLGAELTQVVAELRGTPIRPDEHATRIDREPRDAGQAGGRGPA